MLITFSEYQSILWIIMMLRITSLFCSYYFSHGKSNPRQTLMLIQLITCVGPEYRTRPWVLSPTCRTTSSRFEIQ